MIFYKYFVNILSIIFQLCRDFIFGELFFLLIKDLYISILFFHPIYYLQIFSFILRFENCAPSTSDGSMKRTTRINSSLVHRQTYKTRRRMIPKNSFIRTSVAPFLPSTKILFLQRSKRLSCHFDKQCGSRNEASSWWHFARKSDYWFN